MRRFSGWLAGAVAAAAVLSSSAPRVAEARNVVWTKYSPRGDAKRADVPPVYKWSLANLYVTPDAWEQAFRDAEAMLPSVAACRGTLAKDASALLKGLDLIFEVQRLVSRLQTYADADYSTDQASSACKARTDRVQALQTKLHEARAFLEPELLAMDPAALRDLLKQSPRLAKYEHLVDDLIRRRPHVLSPSEERILALSGDVLGGPGFMHAALDVDVKFGTVHDEDGSETALTMSSFPRFRGSVKREVRQEAVRAFFGGLKAFSRSFAASLDMAIKGDVMVAKARNYGSALECSVDQNAVPPQVFEVLARTAEENLAKTLHRYVALRKKMLGVDAVHYYDLYNPLFPAAKRKVTYPQAIELAGQALKPLGADYLKVLGGGLDPKNGWVDAYPNEGKRSGAYCNASYRDHPIVFLNHMDELDDAFTLVHEFGHAMHFHLSAQAQEYVNSDAPIFLAEIASTFNEELLLDHLLKGAKGRDERLSLLNKRIENIRTTVFRQIMFAMFEADLHHEVESGGALTADRMAELYSALVRKFYGPDYVVDPDDGWEWAYIPHFYYNFYVYQYATGLMSAIALSRPVLAGNPEAARRYLEFLKSGGSDFPVATLQKAGVDLTKPDAMQATFDLFAATMDEVERLVAEPGK